MRIRFLTLLVAIAALQTGADSLQACGDKFVLVGRGAKFRQAYAAIYSASIVVFAQPLRGSSKAIRDPKLHADLKLAGHHVEIAEDEKALVRALETERVDVVLTDATDADRVAADASTSPAKPVVLPVMFEPTKEEAKAIESRYQVRLTNSDRSLRYLSAIDDAMKARVQERKKKAS